MIPKNINSAIKFTINTCLVLVMFTPLYVNSYLFFPFITGKAFAFRILVEVAFALWLILILREKGTTVVNTEDSVMPKYNYVSISVFVFTFVALIADIVGLNPLRSIWSNFERMEGWITIVHLCAYFIVATSVINTKQKWFNFFNVVLFAGFITATYGLLQFFGVLETHQGSRIDASLGNSAYMAVYMLINACIAAYLAVSNFSKKYLLYTYSVLAAFYSFILFQTATRGTILAWIAAILVSSAIYAIFAKSKDGKSNIFKSLNIGLIATVIVVVITFIYVKDAKWIRDNAVLGRLATISISDTKTQARGFVWPMAVKGVFENPKTAIIGVGQENFNYIFNSHYNPKMWSHEQWFDRAHSVFLDWLVAGGLIGLISYLALYVISLVYIVKSTLGVAEKSVLVGLFVGYGIHNIFVFDNQSSYIMFFTVLAFISAITVSKSCVFFKKYTETQSEDVIVIRDYVYVPVILILLVISLYVINIRPINANRALISALRSCSDPKSLSVQKFKDVFAYNVAVANQESREQLLSCAVGVIQNTGVSEATKIDFYNLARAEISNQIKDTPNDARIYIIGGSFFNAISDFNSATPLLEKAAILSPNKQTIIYDLAANYANIGSTTKAVDLLKLAYESATDNQNAKINYIAAMIMDGKEQAALTMFPDKSFYRDRKVINAYIAKKQYNKVIEIYSELLKEEPENQDNYSYLFNAYLLNKQPSKAIETLRAAQKKFVIYKDSIEGIIKQIQEGKL